MPIAAPAAPLTGRPAMSIGSRGRGGAGDPRDCVDGAPTRHTSAPANSIITSVAQTSNTFRILLCELVTMLSVMRHQLLDRVILDMARVSQGEPSRVPNEHSHLSIRAVSCGGHTGAADLWFGGREIYPKRRKVRHAEHVYRQNDAFRL
jgi:hypothetical protein